MISNDTVLKILVLITNGSRDFFFLQGPNSQWNLGDFFSNFGKKFPSLKNKNNVVFFFPVFLLLKIWIFIQSPHTHKLHGDNLLLIAFYFSFNLMAKVYVITN